MSVARPESSSALSICRRGLSPQPRQELRRERRSVVGGLLPLRVLGAAGLAYLRSGIVGFGLSRMRGFSPLARRRLRQGWPTQRFTARARASAVEILCFHFGDVP